jgi:adenosylcobinamide-GDP ribazoletransferase
MAGIAGAPIIRESGTRAQVRACAAAFTFLTRLPVNKVVAHDSDDLAYAATYFPLVGLVVGLAGGAVYAGAIKLWPTPLAIVLSLASTVWMTGAFHEDALADAFDGFGGGWDRAHVLAIMKDSRVGSYAVVGVVLVMGAKIVALVSIAAMNGGPLTNGSASATGITRALVAGHVLGRWSSVPLIRKYPYVRPAKDGERPSAGRPFAGGVMLSQLVAASTAALLVATVAVGSRSVAVIAVAVGLTWLAGRYFARRLGGITGDALGAANQLVELSVYLVLAARFR